jgi:DNA-binding transcriptional ArsR family regulator
MRPLFHPSLDEITVEGILYALSDPVRVSIYADIASQGCRQICSTFLTVRDRAIPKSTLSQHMRILRENGLIRGERHGVQMSLTPRCAEIESRFPGLISAILNAHRIQSGEKGAKKSPVRRPPGSPARR